MSRTSLRIQQEAEYRKQSQDIMSSSLAYGVGVGGLPAKIDPHINLSAIKDSAIFKKNTYTDPLKRLSWGRRARSKERSRSVDPSEEQQAVETSKEQTSPETPYATPPTGSPTTSSSPHQHPSQTQTQISYHSLDSTSPPSQINAILTLSNSVFSETSPTGTTSNEPTKYSSLTTWQSHLSHPTSTIIFATIPSPTPSADVNVVGFIFAHPRSLSDYPPSISSALGTSSIDEGQEILHIWITAVLPAYRSQGIFAELMRMIEDFAREKGVRRLSVATYPGRFARMYDVLKRGGWTLLGEEEKEVDGEVRAERSGKEDEGRGEGDEGRAKGDQKAFLVKNIDTAQPHLQKSSGVRPEDIGVAL